MPHPLIKTSLLIDCNNIYALKCLPQTCLKIDRKISNSNPILTASYLHILHQRQIDMRIEKMKKQNSAAKTLAKISAILGIVFALMLVVSPAFAAESSIAITTPIWAVAAISALSSAIFFEIWRRVARQRQLQNFVEHIRMN